MRRVTAVTLGMVGDEAAVKCLTRALHDEDSQVNQMAEHGLWSIWFRGGNDESSRPFREGVALLVDEDYKGAAERFQLAILLDPCFAEAYNQCAIAHFFLGEYEASLSCCTHAIKHIPHHFGAISGMGHAYTQVGELGKALRYYRKAVNINPRMPAIESAIESLETRYSEMNDETGEFLLTRAMS